jgi:hypothetical protein
LDAADAADFSRHARTRTIGHWFMPPWRLHAAVATAANRLIITSAAPRKITHPAGSHRH